MQGLFVRKVKLRNSYNYMLRNYVLFGFVLIAGLLTGSLLSHTKVFLNDGYFAYLIEFFLASRKSDSFLQVVSISFLSVFLLILLILLLSFCVVGFIFLPVIPFVKGAFIGYLSSYLYINLGAKGVFANIVLFWIPQAVQALIVVCFAAIAFDTSIALYSNNFGNQKQGIASKYKQCLKSFVFMGLWLIFISIIDGALSIAFGLVLL